MKYPCVLQVDVTDCAAACLSSILLYYGKKISISTIRRLAFTDQNGTNGIGLISAAEKLKMIAKAYRIDDINDFLREGKFPCIAHVIRRGFNHYVVIYKLTDEHVIIGDPASGIEKLTIQEFKQYWTNVIFTITPSKDFGGVKEEEGKMARIAKLLFSEKKLILQIILTSILFTVLGFGSSLFFKVLFDFLIPDNNMNRIIIVGLGFVGVTLVQRIIHYVRVNILVRLERKFDYKITVETVKKMLMMPLNFYSSRQSGELIARLNDSYKIREMLSGSSISAFVDMIMVVIGGGILCYLNINLFLIAVVLVGMYGTFTWLFRKRVRNANRRIIESNARVNADYVEMIKGIETVKSLGAEKILDKSITNNFSRFLTEISKMEKTHNVLGFLTNTTQAIGYIIILAVGAYLIIRGWMTSGDLLAFYSMLGFFISPILRIVDLQVNMQGALIAFERIEDIRNNEIENLNEGKEIREPINLIELRAVSFAYGTRENTLNDVSFRIEKGDRIAIIGESGSGKTTLAKLLMSFFDTYEGEILYDGQELRTLQKSCIRSKIVYVAQEPYFFNGTVRDNLLFGVSTDTIDDELILKVAQMFRADSFIKNMPDGLDSHIQEGATNISGGQKQRLALIRAYLRNPEILILDEATSHLDTITEQGISEALGEINRDKTIIVIAHRLNTVNKCDRVIALRNGRIIEQGARKELLSQGGYYAKLMNSNP